MRADAPHNSRGAGEATHGTVVRNTGVTLAMCAILGLLVCLVDFGLGFLIDRLVSL